MGTNIHGTELIPGDDQTDAATSYRFEEIIEELNGFAEVFPEHKYKIVQTFRKIGYRTYSLSLSFCLCLFVHNRRYSWHDD